MKTPVVPKDDGTVSIDTVDGRDSYAMTAFAEIVDRSLHATAARFTMGLSPAALAEAYLEEIT
jgi:polyhydroxyalkanoate synthase